MDHISLHFNGIIEGLNCCWNKYSAMQSKILLHFQRAIKSKREIPYKATCVSFNTFQSLKDIHA